MTNYDDRGFDTRLRRLEKQHRMLRRGHTTHMRSDGLLVLKPRRFSLRRFCMPLVFVVCIGLVIKAVTFASIGEIAYHERVAKLQAGTVAEQYVATLAQIDFVSRWGAEQIMLYSPKAIAALRTLFA